MTKFHLPATFKSSKVQIVSLATVGIIVGTFLVSYLYFPPRAVSPNFKKVTFASNQIVLDPAPELLPPQVIYLFDSFFLFSADETNLSCYIYRFDSSAQYVDNLTISSCSSITPIWNGTHLSCFLRIFSGPLSSFISFQPDSFTIAETYNITSPLLGYNTATPDLSFSFHPGTGSMTVLSTLDTPNLVITSVSSLDDLVTFLNTSFAAESILFQDFGFGVQFVLPYGRPSFIVDSDSQVSIFVIDGFPYPFCLLSHSFQTNVTQLVRINTPIDAPLDIGPPEIQNPKFGEISSPGPSKSNLFYFDKPWRSFDLSTDPLKDVTTKDPTSDLIFNRKEQSIATHPGYLYGSDFTFAWNGDFSQLIFIDDTSPPIVLYFEHLELFETQWVIPFSSSTDPLIFQHTRNTGYPSLCAAFTINPVIDADAGYSIWLSCVEIAAKPVYTFLAFERSVTYSVALLSGMVPLFYLYFNFSRFDLLFRSMWKLEKSFPLFQISKDTKNESLIPTIRTFITMVQLFSFFFSKLNTSNGGSVPWSTWVHQSVGTASNALSFHLEFFSIDPLILNIVQTMVFALTMFILVNMFLFVLLLYFGYQKQDSADIHENFPFHIPLHHTSRAKRLIHKCLAPLLFIGKLSGFVLDWVFIGIISLPLLLFKKKHPLEWRWSKYYRKIKIPKIYQLLISILLIPAVNILLSLASCRYLKNKDGEVFDISQAFGSNQACRSNPFVTFAIVGFVIYVVAAEMLTIGLPFIFPKNSNFQYSVSYSAFLSAYSVIFAIISRLIFPYSGWGLTISLFIVQVIFIYFTYKNPPTSIHSVNSGVIFSQVAVLWTCICAIIALIINDSTNLASGILLFIGWLIIFCGAVWNFTKIRKSPEQMLSHSILTEQYQNVSDITDQIWLIGLASVFRSDTVPKDDVEVEGPDTSYNS